MFDFFAQTGTYQASVEQKTLAVVQDILHFITSQESRCVAGSVAAHIRPLVQQTSPSVSQGAMRVSSHPGN